MADSGFVKVAQVSEIRPGEMMMVNVGSEQVLIANVKWQHPRLRGHLFPCLRVPIRGGPERRRSGVPPPRWGFQPDYRRSPYPRRQTTPSSFTRSRWTATTS